MMFWDKMKTSVKPSFDENYFLGQQSTPYTRSSQGKLLNSINALSNWGYALDMYGYVIMLLLLKWRAYLLKAARLF